MLWLILIIRGGKVYPKKLFHALAILHTTVQISAFQYDSEMSQIGAHTFSLVEPHGLDDPIGGLNRLEWHHPGI